jgi:hypothetical protein
MKYATPLLGLAILLASVVTAAAGPERFVCGEYHVMIGEASADQTSSRRRERTVSISSSYPLQQRYVSIPMFVWDTKTDKATLGGKPCEQPE